MSGEERVVFETSGTAGPVKRIGSEASSQAARSSSRQLVWISPDR